MNPTVIQYSENTWFNLAYKPNRLEEFIIYVWHIVVEV